MKPRAVRESRKEKAIHRVFVWGVWLKAFDGGLEILGGVALLFPGALADLAGILIRNALIENPRNLVAIHLQHALPVFLADSGRFAAIYLFSHGMIKIILAVGLLRDRLWAYPSAMGVFTLFIVYQLYRYTFTHSFFIAALTVLDAAVIWLTWHEYRYFKKHHVFAK